MDKLTAIKIKYDDGTYSDEIPVSVLSENVEWDNTHTLVDVLGSIDVDVTGTIQDQISQLFNEKVSILDMQNYVSDNMNTYITSWLNTNVNPVGSAVIVDTSLSIAGAAADAKEVGNNNSNLKNNLNELSSLFESEMVSIIPVSHPGYRWGFNSYELVAYSTMTAWEFEATENKNYILQGLVVGTANAAAVMFLDNNNNIIGYINNATQESGHKLPITTPLKCVKVIYSTSTNQTWDANPLSEAYKSLANQTPILDNTNDIIDLQNDIIDLQNDINILTDSYPSYYDENNYMLNKINNINNNAPLNGITFAFITDLHFESNALNSLGLLKYIRKHTPINIIISGGDYPIAYGNEDNIKFAYDTVIKYAKELYPDWFSIRGNHDFTIRTSASESTGYTWNDAITKNGIIKVCADWRYEVPTPEVNFYNDTYNIFTNYCWVLTNEKEKIKIIYIAEFISTNINTYWGVTGTIINAYCNYAGQLLKDTDGYTVILVSHSPFTYSLDGGQYNNLIKVIEAFANKTSITQGAYTIDFTSSTGVLACAISGHSHKDQSILENGVLHINTTCDACFNNDPNVLRTRGTITEQAFDIFNIDTTNRTINITRIGGGNNRHFSY